MDTDGGYSEGLPEKIAESKEFLKKQYSESLNTLVCWKNL
jgi:hypothetical protein